MVRRIVGSCKDDGLIVFVVGFFFGIIDVAFAAVAFVPGICHDGRPYDAIYVGSENHQPEQAQENGGNP